MKQRPRRTRAQIGREGKRQRFETDSCGPERYRKCLLLTKDTRQKKNRECSLLTTETRQAPLTKCGL